MLVKRLLKRLKKRTKRRERRFRRRSAGLMMGLALTLGGVDLNALKALQQTVQEESMDPEKRDVKSGDGSGLDIHLPEESRRR